MIPTVPISMGLNEYSKQYSLRKVNGLPEISYVILAQYSGHYFLEATVSPITMKLTMG